MPKGVESARRDIDQFDRRRHRQAHQQRRIEQGGGGAHHLRADRLGLTGARLAAGDDRRSEVQLPMTRSPEQSGVNPGKLTRQARSAATVDVNIEAAARISESAGLAGSTTDAVLERIGVSVGSLDQYLPNKDAITCTLIWRELETLQAVIMAFDAIDRAPTPPTRLIGMVVDQQRRQLALAQLLEAEEDRLAASGDVDPVRAQIP